MGLVLESSAPSVALSLSKMGWMVAPTRGGRGERSFDWMSTTASPNSFIHSHRMHDAARSCRMSHDKVQGVALITRSSKVSLDLRHCRLARTYWVWGLPGGVPRLPASSSSPCSCQLQRPGEALLTW